MRGARGVRVPQAMANAELVLSIRHAQKLPSHIAVPRVPPRDRHARAHTAAARGIALCRLGARGVRVLTPVELVSDSRASFILISPKKRG